MKIVKPSIMTLDELNEMDILKRLESVGRTCYKSEDKITDSSCIEFIKKIINSGHHSILEHVNISVRVICDRGVTHEIVRHRIASYSQESTRYCNYSSDRFENEITVIEPCFWKEQKVTDCEILKKNIHETAKTMVWLDAMKAAEKAYMKLIELGSTPQEARSVLPNSLKTEIVMTMNLREWCHFLTLRTSKAAHPQMREVADMILSEFVTLWPNIFGDIKAE